MPNPSNKNEFKMYARKMKMETKTSKKSWYARDGGINLRMHDIWAAGPGRQKDKKLEREVNRLYKK